jgi:hypothetical protein
MTNKPKWVEALESAERVAKAAEDATDSDTQSSMNAVAHTYLAIAREYREQPTA